MTTPQLISQTTLCAQAHPDRTLFELGDRSLTAAEFARRAQAVGAMLQAAGYSGQRVLIACPPGLDYIVGVLGALHAGAVAVPAYPPMRWVATLAANAADSGAKVALTTNGVAEALDRAALPEPLGQLDWVAIDDVDDPAGWIMPEVTSETLALLQYTSGSTGTPKGVMLTHGNLIAMSAAISALCEYDSASRRVDWLPPYHNTALIGSLLQAVYSGVPCVLLPTQAVLQDPGLWLRTISDRRATISGGPNFAYQLCLRSIPESDREGLDLSCWTLAACGAEPIHAETLDRFAAGFAAAGFRQEALYPCYGLSESTLLVSAGGQGDPPRVLRRDGRSLVGCGRPLPGHDVRIVGPQGRALPHGEPGEIWVAGPAVSPGYWQRPKATEEAFGGMLAAAPRQPFLRTGDIGFLEDDELYITGRLKQLIVLHGRNYDPVTIEATMAEAHPSLQGGGGAAFTVAGDGEDELVCLQETTGASVDALVPARRAVAARHGLSIAHLVLVAPGSLPRTPTGKIQRGACRDAYRDAQLSVVTESRLAGEAGAPAEPVFPGRAALADKDRSQQQALLVESLGQEFDRTLGGSCDPDTPLTALGLDSISACSVGARITRALKVELPWEQLLAGPTLRELASSLTDLLAHSPVVESVEAPRLDDGKRPLNSAQQRIWYLSQLEAPHSYHLTVGSRLDGTLDVDALRDALTALARRHPALHSYVESPGGRPALRDDPATAIDLEVHDLRDLPPGQRATEVLRLVRECVQHPFALERLPLWRAALLHTETRSAQLWIVLHHLVSDGWSIGVLSEELGALYAARVGDSAARPLPQLAPEPPARGETKADRAFWRGRLAGAPARIALPVDHARSGACLNRGERLSLGISPERTAALAELGRAHGCTLFMTMLSAWAALLARQTRQEDLIVGTLFAERDTPEAQQLIGCYFNILPLRIDASGDIGFGELLERVRAEVLTVMSHRRLPIETLRLLSRAPRHGAFPQVMFGMENMPLPPLVLPGVDVTPLAEPRPGTSKFELDLRLRPAGGGLCGYLEYDSQLFEKQTAARISEQFEQLLAEVTQDAMRSLSRIPLIDAARRECLLAGGCTARPIAPQGAPTLGERFAVQAVRTPELEAVVHRGVSVHYAELELRANRLAHLLIARGSGPEQLVGLYFERSIEMIVALLAVTKSGAAYLPLDPNHPAKRLAGILEDAGVALVVTHAALVDRRPACDGSWVCVDADATTITEQPSYAPRATATAESLAYVIYTSGSTGKPKGVQIEQRQVTRLFDATRDWFVFDESDCWTMFHSIAFDFSVWEIWGALLHGGRLVIVPDETARAPRDFARLLVDEQVTVLNQTPSAFSQLVLAETPPEALALRLVIFGGEPLDMATLAPWIERHGDRRPELINMYGITETTVHVTYRPIRTADLSRPDLSPIGVPIPDLELLLLDDGGHPVPNGVPGEIHIGGAGVARGYLNRPALTAERFVPHPLREGDRLYRSGDLGRRMTDGTLVHLGRIDQQVQLRGHRIEPGEVEAALAAHPDLHQAIVQVREDTPGHSRLVAYLVARADVNVPEPSVLRDHLGPRLPSYMVPAAFVALPVLPLTPNGKLDRAALPAPGREDVGGVSIEPPRTALERSLAAHWAERLALEAVGRDDDFFELGGHSLLATELLAWIEAEHGAQLALRTLLDAPTIAGLTTAIETSDRILGLPRALPDPGQRHEPFPLTPIQQAYWVGRGDALELGNVSAHTYIELEQDGLDTARAEQALRQLIARHEMLRAIVRSDGLQHILPADSLPPYVLAVDDLTDAPTEARVRQLDETRARMSHQVFPADIWPLFEIRVSRLDDRTCRLHVGIDALIADAHSFQLMLEEWRSLIENPHAELPEATLSFRDYVLATQQVDTHPRYQKDKAYWLDRLDGLPSPPELPLQPHGEGLENPTFVRLDGALDAEPWKILQQGARERGLTPSGVLAACFAEVVGRWSRRRSFMLHLTRFQRLPLHPEVGQIVGDFTATSLLAVEQHEGPFAERADALQQRLWEDLEHGLYSGVEVVREQARATGGLGSMPMLVVFTSLLGQPELFGRPDERLIYSVSQTPQVMLDHQARERADGAMVWSWDVVEGVLADGVVEAMFEAYAHVLELLASDPDAWSRDLGPELLPVGQWTQRDAANATEASWQPELLHDGFLRQAGIAPQRTAVIDAAGQLTYGELAELSAGLARRLHMLGTKPEQLVAVVMDKGCPQVTACLSILQAGGAYLPIDSSWPRERRWSLLERCGVQTALTQSDLDNGDEWPAGITRIAVDRWTAADCPEGPDPPTPAVDGLAYVIFTSGSTGEPKGVMIDHQAAMNTIGDINERFDVGPEDRVLALSALSFDLSVWDLFGILGAGGAIVMPEPGTRRDPAHWIACVERHRVSIWNTVPQLLGMLVGYVADREAQLDSLRLALLSGDWIPVDLPADARRLMPELTLVSLGGATEAAIWSILYPIGDVDPSWTSIPYGHPMRNQRFRILDERMAPVPDWVAGELYIAGDGLALGYWADRDKTDERFFENPLTGERLYRTGDLGRWRSDGEIEFLGREDFQVKIQGYRIELGEIEAALRGHPDVDAAVVAAPTLGTAVGAPRLLVAYVVPLAGTRLDTGRLSTDLAEHLPPYMVPSQIVTLDRLPLSANGKVDRAALPGAASENTPTEEAPRTPVEEVLCEILAGLLGRPTIGIHDNFFALGGDSLLGIQAITKANHQGIEITPRRFFAAPTVAGMAAAIGSAAHTEPIIHRPARLPGARVPLTPIQRWFFGMELPEPAHWNQSLLLGLKQGVPADRLADALHALGNRHEALRLRYAQGADGWIQTVADASAAFPLEIVPYRDPGCADPSTILRAATMRAQASLDLSDGPLARAVLFEPPEGGHQRLFLTLHHLIVDGLSWRILLDQLEALLEGRPLGPVCPFGDWAVAHTELVEALPGESEAGMLPEDVPGGSNRESDARIVRGMLDAHHTAELISAPGRGSCIEALLVGAVGQALAEWTGDRTVRIDLESHGRTDHSGLPDVGGTVGWFTALYPTRLTLPQANDAASLLAAVQRGLDAVPDPIRFDPSAAAPAGVVFNYLGNLDPLLASSPYFERSTDPGVAADRSPLGRRPYALEITSWIAGGRFVIEWAYSGAVYRPETIENLSQTTVDYLRTLIQTLEDPEPLQDMESAVDLVAAARLEPPLVLPPAKIVEAPRDVLLTGATGFLGAFLLVDLLTDSPVRVHCIVRAEDGPAGQKRLEQVLRGYGLWQPQLAERVVVLAGDVSQPKLGLSDACYDGLVETIDAVYHSAASVNLNAPFPALAPVNVHGTETLIRLAAAAGRVPLFHISTTSVFPLTGHPPDTRLMEVERAPGVERLYGGYAQSKWVGEQLVREAGLAGLPVAVFRPGTISSHTESGAGNSKDLFYRVIEGALALGAAPDVPLCLDLVPVDYVSRAIVTLARRPDSIGGVFHLTNESPLKLSALVEWSNAQGRPLERLSIADWRMRLYAQPADALQLDALFAFTALVEELDLGGLPSIDDTQTREGLAGSGISCPPADLRLLDICLKSILLPEA